MNDLDTKKIGELKGPVAFAPGDFVLDLESEDPSFVKVVEKEAHRILVRHGEPDDISHAEWWTTADKITYPSDRTFWSANQHSIVAQIENQEGIQRERFSALSTEFFFAAFGVLTISALTLNLFLNEGKIPPHSLSRFIAFGAVCCAGKVVWEYWKDNK